MTYVAASTPENVTSPSGSGKEVEADDEELENEPPLLDEEMEVEEEPDEEVSKEEPCDEEELEDEDEDEDPDEELDEEEALDEELSDKEADDEEPVLSE